MGLITVKPNHILTSLLFFHQKSQKSGGLCSFYPFLLAAFVSIKIYPNAEADKEKILKENKDKSGIYRWKNNINGKQYIGSAVDLTNRLWFYYSFKAMENLLKRSQSHICSALLKYDHSNFSLIILEYCEPSKCLER